MTDKTHSVAFRDQPIDIHCHRVGETTHLQILSLDTHELAGETDGLNIPSNCFISIGIHPWFIERQNPDHPIQKLESYRDHPKLLAVGECGLDKTVTTDLARQISLFEQQITLAEQWRKPLMIHCVRAYNELLQLKKKGCTSQPWIIHGFNNNPELAKQLLKQGCYLSLGKALLREQSNAAKTLQRMPLDRLFLETDAAADISISAIYAAAAKITGLAIASLRRQIVRNFTHVFLND
ncbi:TatD family hydrolase [Methylomarinum vadi]|uniref:TatD family hydrolase n=1 Tax=Methylomarinum vadi TaxID=438855 RepID=UPI000563693C|nr:TatD family hydrolase [Methylomarinum vadi]